MELGMSDEQRFNAKGFLADLNEQRPIVCPFCGEGDFDQAGLVHHLDEYCGEYEAARKEWVEVQK